MSTPFSQEVLQKDVLDIPQNLRSGNDPGQTFYLFVSSGDRLSELYGSLRTVSKIDLHPMSCMCTDECTQSLDFFRKH